MHLPVLLAPPAWSSPEPGALVVSPEQLLARLQWLLAEWAATTGGGLAVSFSGGVDSTLVLAVARRTVPVVAFTGVSPSLGTDALAQAQHLADRLACEHHLLPTDEFNSQDYLANTPQRCFHCKMALYTVLAPHAAARNLVLVDGNHVDDLRAPDRPGLRAAAQCGVRHPLAQAGFDKQAVRTLSRWLGLPTADLPASPCLASRIPHGTPVTLVALQRVEQAERALKTIGLQPADGVLRVRDLGPATAGMATADHTPNIHAAVELTPAALASTSPQLRAAATQVLQTCGYTHVQWRAYIPAGQRRPLPPN